MIHFGAFQYVWIICLLIGGLSFLAYQYWEKYGSMTAKSALVSHNRNYTFQTKTAFLKLLLILAGMIILSMALLRPQWGMSEQTVQKKGLDILFALDVSNSMKALDFSSRTETVDRLQASKFLIEAFAKTRAQDRLGLVEFAGETFVASPLTLDHAAFLNFLSGVGPNDVGKQGTNLAEALSVALARFEVQSPEERGKAIILISDGDETVNSKIENLAKKAQASGIKIYTIGVGSPNGSAIPEGQDAFGRMIYKKYKGQTVTSKLNPEPLKRIANITGGTYFRAKDRRDILKLSDELKKLPAQILEDEIVDTHSERYQLFIILGITLLLMGYFLPLSWNANKLSLIPHRRLSILGLVFGTMMLSGCSYQNELVFKHYNKLGNNNFVQKEWDEALKYYQKAPEFQNHWNIISENNALAVAYEQGQFENLVKKQLPTALKQHCTEGSLSPFCENLWYLTGNAYYRWGETKSDEAQKALWQSAVTAYKNALTINPQNTWAQENIDFILKKQQEQASSNEPTENKNSKDKKGGTSESEETNSESSSNENQKNDTAADSSEDQSNDSSSTDQSQADQATKPQSGASEGDSANQAENGSEESGAESKSGSDEKSDTGEKSSPTPSRLPQQMQKQLQDYQKQLEQSESKNQDYFHRSKASAENQASQDPFANFFPQGSLFKDFFGEDPFQDFFGRGEKHFNKNLNTDEKDW